MAIETSYLLSRLAPIPDQPPALSNQYISPLTYTVHNVADHSLSAPTSMADIDRMFRSELAVLADQPTQSDLWVLDPSPFDGDTSWDSPLLADPPDTTLGLFPDPRLPTPPQPTAHLADHSLRTTSPPLMIPPGPAQIPLTDSPTDSLVQTGPSSEDMDSDDFDFDLAYPSESEFILSPTSIDPAALSMTDPHAASTRPSRRASRSMSKVPVPIPNLTKKSRGRKVPTSNGEPVYAASRDKTKKGVRTYTCHADGCGKCFVRGEHLKRHIRSIHTDEKRGWDSRLRLHFFLVSSFVSSLPIGSPFFCLKHGSARTRTAVARLAGGTT